MKSLELFAGAGGLGMGLQAAGFEPTRVVEWDRYCCETLRLNRAQKLPGVTDWKEILQSDVRECTFQTFSGQLDLISGGPPCQPFSMGGKHRAYNDTRDMFPQAIRAVREAQPKAFIFENVKGLTRAAFSNYFQYIQLQMEHPEVAARPDEDWEDHLRRLERHHISGRREDLHYRVVTRVLNAANFGIPQRRERVFFVGFRDDLGLEWNFPQETHSLDALLWDQANGDYWERHRVPTKHREIDIRKRQRIASLKERPRSLPSRTVRDALQGLPEPKVAKDRSEVANHALQPGARSYAGHTGSALDLPAKTLKAGVHGVPGGENMLLRPDGTVRYFTVRESARLQTFPDAFEFHGSWTEAMRQLGNAVPVELATVVGKSVASLLSGRTNSH